MVLPKALFIYFIGTSDQPFGENEEKASSPPFPAIRECQGVRRRKGKQETMRI